MENAWINEINDRLMDEESKRIFASRVLYTLTGDKTYLYHLGHVFKKRVCEEESWKAFLALLEKEEQEGLYLYGAGAYGTKILEMTPGIRWSAVLDKAPRAASLGGVPVIKTEEYLQSGGKGKIVVSSKRYYEEVCSFLVQNGVDQERILDGRLLYDLTEGQQYFDLEALPLSEKELFLDVGCCDGMSSVQFMKWCKGAGRCVCFEPDPANIVMLQKNLREKGIREEDYRLVPKGAWSENGVLSFVANGTGSSHVDGIYGGSNGADTETIQVTTIDEAAGAEPVTFIKMDIEGSELNALKGAASLIKEKKPKLAICVYHKAEDIREIPQYILGLRPDYQLYLRHYSFEESETVLYAI